MLHNICLVFLDLSLHLLLELYMIRLIFLNVCLYLFLKLSQLYIGALQTKPKLNRSFILELSIFFIPRDRRLSKVTVENFGELADFFFDLFIFFFSIVTDLFVAFLKQCHFMANSLVFELHQLLHLLTDFVNNSFLKVPFRCLLAKGKIFLIRLLLSSLVSSKVSESHIDITGNVPRLIKLF